MKDFFGLEMGTQEDLLRIRLAARIAYQQGGFPDEAMQLLEDVEDEPLISHILNRVSPPWCDNASSITSVTIALFQDYNSRLRESIEQCRNHSYKSIEAYFKVLGAAAGIKDLFTVYCVLTDGGSIPCVHPKSFKTIGLPDDRGECMHIDGRAALRRAAIAAMLVVYMKFPNPEEVMEMEIRWREAQRPNSDFSA